MGIQPDPSLIRRPELQINPVPVAFFFCCIMHPERQLKPRSTFTAPARFTAVAGIVMIDRHWNVLPQRIFPEADALCDRHALAVQWDIVFDPEVSRPFRGCILKGRPVDGIFRRKIDELNIVGSAA